MKKNYSLYIFTVLLLLFSVEVKAQTCTPVLDAATLVVTSDTTINPVTSQPLHFLICSGATLTYQGWQSQQIWYYLETGAKVKLRTYHYPYIYMKSGAELDAGYSLVPMTIMEVNYESGAIFTDTSSQYIVSLNLCTPLTFDYTQIPGGVAPCSTSTGISENRSDAGQFIIYPNPAGESFTLSVGNDVNITQVVLYDLTGQEIILKSHFSESSSIIFDRQNIPAGIYFMKISSNGQDVMKKLVLR